ncbi:MAG: UDP-N-acetylglucosamine 2-epimerase (hydrolyzing) [Kiritimatiellae bacterium]|nr:UDP-N-acetylglucosamine 2-epimerase (hydrolyzing) [Kiritimatiellia bacterium]
MRRIGVVTVGRSDYSILLPVLAGIRASSRLALYLIAAGAHFSAKYGLTGARIEADGLGAQARVDLAPEVDTPQGIASAMGRGLAGFAEVYARAGLDVVLVAGDRFETLAAVAAAAPFALPVAHLHGGETTEGAMDEGFRHAITKMSHLHFVSMSRYGERLRRMGEEPWRITVSGAPALDNVRRLADLPPHELEGVLQMPVDPPPLLVTFHPVTLEHDRTGPCMAELCAALAECGKPIVFTYPNADTGSDAIIDAITRFAAARESARVVRNLGPRAYYALLRRAAALVGNSSSGIIEAASFRLPVVNVGSRQRGRYRAQNVVDVPCERGPISEAIARVTAPAFREALGGLENPYGDGRAGPRIVERLETVVLDRRLIQKVFYTGDA